MVSFIPSLHPSCTLSGWSRFTKLPHLKRRYHKECICLRPCPFSSFAGPVSMTLNAHRLVSKAYEIARSAVQSALITLIFRAYCEDDLDINDHEVLADAAEQSGAMSKVEVSMSLLCWLVGASARNPPFHRLRWWRSLYFNPIWNESNIAKINTSLPRH